MLYLVGYFFIIKPWCPPLYPNGLTQAAVGPCHQLSTTATLKTQTMKSRSQRDNCQRKNIPSIFVCFDGIYIHELQAQVFEKRSDKDLLLPAAAVPTELG